jgi:hypothetical protein
VAGSSSSSRWTEIAKTTMLDRWLVGAIALAAAFGMAAAIGDD